MYNFVQNIPSVFRNTLEPIKPQLPWQRCQYGTALPEAELIFAIINQAFEDAYSYSTVVREEARRWFDSYQFKQYCDLVGLNGLVLRENVIQQWRKM